MRFGDSSTAEFILSHAAKRSTQTSAKRKWAYASIALLPLLQFLDAGFWGLVMNVVSKDAPLVKGQHGLSHRKGKRVTGGEGVHSRSGCMRVLCSTRCLRKSTCSRPGPMLPSFSHLTTFFCYLIGGRRTIVACGLGCSRKRFRGEGPALEALALPEGCGRQDEGPFNCAVGVQLHRPTVDSCRRSCLL